MERYKVSIEGSRLQHSLISNMTSPDARATVGVSFLLILYF